MNNQNISAYRDIISPSEMISFYAVSDSQYLNMNKIISLLSDPEASVPSHLAKIHQKTKISEIIKKIDEAFGTAIEDYRQSLKEAHEKDLQTTKKERDTSSDFALSVATYAARFIIWNPHIPIIKEIVGPLLGFIGGAYGAYNSENFSREKKQIEESANRNKWLAEVLILEDERIKKAAKEIYERALTLQRKIEASKKNFSFEDEFVKELIQLDTLMNVFSPKNHIRLNDCSVTNYLCKLIKLNDDAIKLDEGAIEIGTE